MIAETNSPFVDVNATKYYKYASRSWKDVAPRCAAPKGMKLHKNRCVAIRGVASRCAGLRRVAGDLRIIHEIVALCCVALLRVAARCAALRRISQPAHFAKLAQAVRFCLLVNRYLCDRCLFGQIIHQAEGREGLARRPTLIG